METKHLLPYERHKIKKRTRHIYYEGSKYHRRAIWHRQRVYIVSFLGVNCVQLEMTGTEDKFGRTQIRTEVDDKEFIFKEYKS